MANPVGRPTKYNAELQAKADEYIFNWQELGDVIPSRVGLCCYLGIDKTTSYDWERIYPEFSNTLRNIDTMQERIAVNGGMKGEFNSVITKLVLANHGYSDKQAVDHTSSDKSMSPAAQGDAVLAAIKAKHDAK